MSEATDTDAASLQALFERQWPLALALRLSTRDQRVRKLERLRVALLSRREALYAAFAADLGKPRVEVDLTELLPVVEEVGHAIRHLKAWMRPQRVGATLTTLGSSAQVQYQPRGRCLIIGPWNYPVSTLLGPLVSAIAAGNTVVLKPSELTPQVSAVVAELVRGMTAEVFDPAEVAVAQGGVPTAQHLLTLPFDHFFFTGSPAVGKLVMAAAAQHLASVTLELGGKSPVIVDESADLERAAALIIWGKLTNAGQSCVAPDHLYVHRSVKDRFVQCCQRVIAARYGTHAAAVAASPDLGRLVSTGHASRVAALVDDALAHGATLLAGGQHDAKQCYVAPTLLTQVPRQARISQEEIFGPVLPIEGYEVLDEVLARINAAPKPLALYVWTRNASVARRVQQHTSSGGVCVNHCMQQFAHPGLPFGGVNNSGLGNAHGVHGFKAFSHERAVLASGPLTPLSLFYPPYTGWTARLSEWLVRLLAWL